MKKNFYLLTLLIFLLFPFDLFPRRANSTIRSSDGTFDNGATFTTSEDTFTYSLFREWNNETMGQDEITSEHSWTDIDFVNYEDSKGNWIVKKVETITTDKTTFYHKRAYIGNASLTINLTTYRVDVNSDNLQFTWHAVKEGILEEERQISYEHTDTYQSTNRTERRFITLLNYTDSFKQTLLENTTYQEIKYTNFTCNPPPSKITDLQYIYAKMRFVAPMILIFQKYTTQNDRKVAWGQLLWEMIVFNDTDRNGIYNAAEFSGDSEAHMSLKSGDEFVGELKPIASEIVYKMHKEDDLSTMSHPTDRDLETFINDIQYTAPYLENDHLLWNISYLNMVCQAGVEYKDRYYYNPTLKYEDLIPNNYSYSFDYYLDTNKARLEYEFNAGEFSDPYYKSNVSGFGISIPSHTYLISDTLIQQNTSNAMSVPTDEFDFAVDGETAAEVDLSEDAERIYQLEDFEGEGIISNHISRGASVNFHCTAPLYYGLKSGGYGFERAMLSTESLVSSDPKFMAVDNLYEIETINYPEWGGHALHHDPQLNAYFKASPSDDDDSSPNGDDTPPDDNGEDDDTPSNPPSIGIPSILGITGTLLVGVLISVFLNKKRIKRIK